MLMGFDDIVAGQSHVEELRGVRDDLRLAEVNRVAEDMEEAEPALCHAVITHTGGDQVVVIFWDVKFREVGTIHDGEDASSEGHVDAMPLGN